MLHGFKYVIEARVVRFPKQFAEYDNVRPFACGLVRLPITEAFMGLHTNVLLRENAYNAL